MSGYRQFSVVAISETFATMLFSIATFATLLMFHRELLRLIVDEVISVDNLYNAVFGWASLQTGCLYAIYGYIAGKTDGFVGEIRLSRSMIRYNSYLRRATSIGFLLTVTSMR